MHKLMLNIFNLLKNIVYFFKIAGMFYMMMMSLYWIENIIGAQWNWMNFIKPSLDIILSISEKISSQTYVFWNANIEMRFVYAIILLFVWIFAFRFLYIGLCYLQVFYETAHNLHKKTTENVFNYKLKMSVTAEEKKIKTYSVLIYTKIKKKFSHKEINIDVAELSGQMNSAIAAKTGVKHMIYKSGFLYTYDNIEKIDEVLDVLFSIMQKDAPLQLSISVQAGDKLTQLETIASFEIYDKIVFAADTLLRYRVNKTHRYQTSCLGEFKHGVSSLELHEFQTML